MSIGRINRDAHFLVRLLGCSLHHVGSTDRAVFAWPRREMRVVGGRLRCCESARLHVSLESAWWKTARLLRTMPGAEIGWRGSNLILDAAANQRFQLILRQQAEWEWRWAWSLLLRFLHLGWTNDVVSRAGRHWSWRCGDFIGSWIAEIG